MWSPRLAIALLVVLTIPTHAQELLPVNVSQMVETALDFYPFMERNEKDLSKVVGPLPKRGEKPEYGWYGDLIQAYHFNVYGSRFYDRGRVLMKWWGEIMTKIRRSQVNWKLYPLKPVIDDCKVKNDTYYAVKATKPDGEEMKTFMNDCSGLEELLNDIDLDLARSLIYAYHLLAAWMHLACDQGGELYRFNGKRMIKSKDSQQIGLFNRMNKEYLDLGNALPKLLEELEEHIKDNERLDPKFNTTRYGKVIKKASDDINAKLRAPPFDVLYEEDATKRQNVFDAIYKWFEPTHLSPKYPEDQRSICYQFDHDLGSRSKFLDEHNFVYHWDKFMKPEDIDAMFDLKRGPLQQFYDGITTPYNPSADPPEPVRIVWTVNATKDFIDDFYKDYLKVEKSKNGPDGKWNWEIGGRDDVPDKTKARQWVHRIRLGSDLLDSVVEELKCYLNQTFDQEKRKVMLENYEKSVNWTNAKMFNDISRTLARPCVTANDSDLVGTCTRANHEICMPMYYHTEFQNPLDESKGGMSLMKPKWYYRKMADGKCQGKRTYITHYKICQCGFRTDCGSDLKGSPQITCQFVENDLIRKQCRGSIAYPCRTHPFQKGKPHETCATGFCDLEENSCERWHWHIFE